MLKEFRYGTIIIDIMRARSKHRCYAPEREDIIFNIVCIINVIFFGLHGAGIFLLRDALDVSVLIGSEKHFHRWRITNREIKRME